jgi:hypothetical protein
LDALICYAGKDEKFMLPIANEMIQKIKSDTKIANMNLNNKHSEIVEKNCVANNHEKSSSKNLEAIGSLLRSAKKLSNRWKRISDCEKSGGY